MSQHAASSFRIEDSAKQHEVSSEIILSQCYSWKSKFSMVWCWVTGWAVSNVSRDEGPAVPDTLLDPQDETLKSSKFQALFNRWDSIAEERDIMKRCYHTKWGRPEWVAHLWSYTQKCGPGLLAHPWFHVLDFQQVTIPLPNLLSGSVDVCHVPVIQCETQR
jgi:hypothetical protein